MTKRRNSNKEKLKGGEDLTSTIDFVSEGAFTCEEFLSQKGVSQRQVKSLISREKILVSGKKAGFKTRIFKGDIVKIAIDEENIDFDPIMGPLDIVYENDDFLVVNKGNNITVNSKGQISLANHLAYYFLENRIKAKIRFVNRLDMNTRGLLIVAKSSLIHGYIQKHLHEKVKRKYVGLVKGKISGKGKLEFNLRQDIDKSYKNFPDGKKSITKYRSIYTSEKYSLLEFSLLTGRSHQIRASLREIGHPLIGDELYGDKRPSNSYFLLAYNLTVPDIRSGDVKEFNVDYKADLSEYLTLNKLT